MSITVYGQDDCDYCEQTKQYYGRQGIPIEYINLSLKQNADTLQKLKDRGFSSTPIVETSTETWSGRRPDLLVKSAMEYRADEQRRQELLRDQAAAVQDRTPGY